MLAASAGLVSSAITSTSTTLAHYGDTTSVDAQLQTLRALGLDVEFTKEGTPEMIEESISRGAAVLVGWLHAGDLTKGEPPMCDHLKRSLVSGDRFPGQTQPRW